MTTVTLDKLYITAADVAAKEFTYGDVVSHEWLIDKLELAVPSYGSRADFVKHQLAFMEGAEGFKSRMLEEYKMYLTPVRGLGYKIVQPNEQTDFAMKRLKTVVKKEIGKATSALINVNDLLMDADEMKHRDNHLGKIAALAAFSKTSRIGIAR